MTNVHAYSLKRRLLQLPLRLLEVLGIYRLCRMLTRRHVRVLMYHGVSDVALGPDYWLMLPREAFAWQMSYLERHFRLEPWTCLAADGEDGPTDPRPAAVITFDDAFANVQRNALDLLARGRYPAVLFVIPDLSLRKEEIWTTRIFRLLLESDLTHVPVDVVAAGRLSLPRDRAERRAVLRRYVHGLKWKTTDEIRSVVEQIVRVCSSGKDSAVAREFELMTMEAIQDLARTPWVSVGTHTNAHFSLTSLSADEQERQIADSLALLREYGVNSDPVFAYPSGHFNADTLAILRKHGFRAAFTTEEGLHEKGDDLLQVRRIAIGGDMTRPEFKARVSGLYHLVAQVRRRLPGRNRRSDDRSGA